MNKNQCDHCIYEQSCSLRCLPNTDDEPCNSFIDINDFDLDSTDSMIWSEMSWNRYIDNSYTYEQQI